MKKMILSIPKPCHESWDEMTTVEKGKFCGACQKTVIDFTEMNDRQIAEFFRRPSASVCGRFHDDQLDRNIAIPRKRVPWIKYFFQFSLPAFLVSMKASAQSRKVLTGDTIICAPVITTNPQNSLRKATKKITPVNPGKMVRATKNIEPLNLLDAGHDKLAKFPELKIRPFVKPVEEVLVGRVGGIASQIVVTDSWIEDTVSLVKKLIVGPSAKFAVYPNPASGNSNVKIDLKKMEAGGYTISLIDLTGKVIQEEEVIVENKGQLLNFHINATVAGTYFVRVFNRKTAASFSEKLVIAH